ncbi:uncharacterized protein LOC121010042 [Herpailurus yagouaroundi]|uniref:uncharacterized protein LOC121010042 n=1 Tax=Herpailurus yagouaroundi TaxID=1608482 RepID=UPI001AD664B6|nr:uncharacterized protein LOC121010042 [Puma yagouaroundi]
MQNVINPPHTVPMTEKLIVKEVLKQDTFGREHHVMEPQTNMPAGRNKPTLDCLMEGESKTRPIRRHPLTILSTQLSDEGLQVPTPSAYQQQSKEETEVRAYHLGARLGSPQTHQTPSQRVVPETDRPSTLSSPPLIPQALPAASVPPVAPLVAPPGEPGGREVAAAPEPGGRQAAAAPGPIENETNHEGPAGRTCGRTQREPNPRLPDSTVALPLREIGPPDETGNPNPRLQYWPFSTSDLYNWKTQNARFSDNPKDLIALLDSVMFTHQPTWDDCQQLLCILFTTEERERIQLEARKLVPGNDGRPTSNPDLINAAFPEPDLHRTNGTTTRQKLPRHLKPASREPKVSCELWEP